MLQDVSIPKTTNDVVVRLMVLINEVLDLKDDMRNQKDSLENLSDSFNKLQNTVNQITAELSETQTSISQVNEILQKIYTIVDFIKKATKTFIVLISLGTGIAAIHQLVKSLI